MVSSSLLSRRVLSLGGAGLLAVFSNVGCGDDSNTPSGGSPAGGSPNAGGGGAGAATLGGSDLGGAGGTPVVDMPKVKTIIGDVTWQVTFDDAAITAGATNCSYTRHYEGTEDESAKWFCPSCDVIFRATVEMTAGQADCFTQISADPPLTEEWIGYDSTAGTYYRGYGMTMTSQGTLEANGDALSTTNQILDQMAPVGGTFSFDVAGTFTQAEADGDPLNGFHPPDTYACGWPKTDPAPYTGDYTLAEGGTLPDGLFKDACGETVRLHDLAGRYLIVEMAARDCPPCQQMATDEEAFIADMEAQGVEVKVVTLLAPSLADPLGIASQAQLNNWKTNFSLTSPILADRGWGLSMFEPLYGDQVGFPSLTIVDPNLKVIAHQSGYGGFADIKAAILADAGL
ncbi:MAG: redoxin family protein [Polyangiaceae bacterium]